MSLRRWTSSSDVFEGSLYFWPQHLLATWIFMNTAVWTSHLAFITVFTGARLLSVSWATLTQYISSNSIYLSSTLILSSLLCYPLFSSFSANKTPHIFLLTVHATCSIHLIFLCMISQVIYGQECKARSSSLHSTHNASLTFSFSDLSAAYSRTQLAYSFP